MTNWLMRWVSEPEHADARLFCFPYAGGGAAAYRHWPRSLGRAADLYAIQLPGRANRLKERPLDDMQALVETLRIEILPFLDKPFAFFGHSMGSVLATELCRLLAQRGEPVPVQLFVSGRRPVAQPDPEAPLRHLSDEAFIDEINRRYGGIPPEVVAEPDLLALLIPALRADITALETYHPGVHKPLDCPIQVFGGSDDPLTPRTHLDAWKTESRLDVEIQMFPGGHFYLERCREQVVAEVWRKLLLRLERAVAEAGS